MDYLGLIKTFFEAPEHRTLNNFFETIYCLTSSLKKQGLTKKNITQEIIDEMTVGFLNKNVKTVYKIKFGHYLIYYLGFLMDLDYDYEHTEKFDKIMTNKINNKLKVEETEVTPIDKLEQSDFKPKEYSSEFLELIGVSEGDIR